MRVMTLRSLNVGPRAVLGFAVLAFLVVLLGAFALLKMSEMSASSAVVNENALPSIVAVGQLRANLMTVQTFTARLLQQGQADQRQQRLQRIEELKGKLASAKLSYERLISSPQERAKYDEFVQDLGRYLEAEGRVAELVRADSLDAALDLAASQMRSYDNKLDEQLNELMALNEAAATSAVQRSYQAVASARSGVIVAIVVALVITVVLALLLTRSIVTPLNEALKVVETIAAGDLTQSIRVEGSDEPARLLLAMQSMQQNLRTTIHGIADSSNQLASASEELSAVTEDATRGLHQQSNEIEQAATAVNEMTTAVDEVARNAVSTSEASRESDLTARQGREQVIKTVDAIVQLAQDVTTTSTEIEHLAGKVRDISQVLDVIRAIAEQTNLLALNAAIEAARAGDAGRGFAVVADEVRKLAHRTQQSTQEIEQMVSGIQQGTEKAVNAMQSSNGRAEESLEVARAAGKALDEITLAISQISERNMVIASASEEQAQVAREVDRNLVNIRDLALQSSAGANQTSAASLELSRLAIDLNTMVARFTV